MKKSDYVKQLEETIELLKKKFEDYSVENESLQEYYWNDLTCILPKQEGHIAHCIMYSGNGLTIENGDYTVNCNDIVNSTDVWNEIYGKPSSYSIPTIQRMKNTIAVTERTEIIKTLFTTLLTEANSIAQGARCGSGNVVVVSEEVATYFTLLNQFVGINNNGRQDGFRIYKLGSLGRFTIFVDKKNTTNKAVVIYKGERQNDGAGVILDNKGIHHWFRPNGYNNYWKVIDIT